jgi:L-lactate utilization protein LutB
MYFVFKVLHALAGTLGFSSLTIQAVGMDHSYSIRNAAIDTGGAEGVVDCSIHIDRRIMKNRDKLQNPKNLDTVRSHFRMLVMITMTEKSSTVEWRLSLPIGETT